MGIEKLRPFTTMVSVLGNILLEDDKEDIGKFDRLHHWQYGFILMRLANLGHHIINNHLKNKKSENARKNPT